MKPQIGKRGKQAKDAFSFKAYLLHLMAREGMHMSVHVYVCVRTCVCTCVCPRFVVL